MTTEPRLHVDVHDGDGPFLLLVHGMYASRATWLPNLDALSAVARPVVVELWGHGRSPAPVDAERHRPEAYVEELEALRRELGCDRWLVCGASLGAALTLRYALEHPGRVIAQVFTNTNSALADDAWRAGVEPFVEDDARRLLAGGHAYLRKHPLVPGPSSRLPEPARSALLADVELHDPAGLASMLRHTVPASPVRDRVGENRVPSLLVVGEREAAFADVRRFAEATMPHLEVVATPAGHAVNIEAADAFNAAVTAFVTSHSSSAGAPDRARPDP